ncbi:BspA family leucine-rich repeat surface protein [Muricauda sp. NFXS6]|uniref:BspA family leucine-rich repeat surface protein n=1 Tax=Allomuricauda sp. NFXS6 TaxID=2819094 RepID=UPI0032DFE3C9
MKHLLYKFGIGMLAVALVWSCSKNDGASTPPKPEPTNTAPTISAQGFEVPENITDADEIGTVAASDSDEGDVLTFSIAENELFEITEAGSLSLKTGKSLNFEAKSNYEVNVTVTDSEGETASATITITVFDVAEANPDDPTAFVTVWQTDMANETIYIGLVSHYYYNFTINWGDGTVEEISSANNNFITHEYAEAGEHTVAIIGDFPAIWMEVLGLLNLDPAPKAGYGLVGIEQWGDIQWKSMNYAFMNATMLENYYATDIPDLSNVPNMRKMFMGASSFNGDLSEWDVSSVTDMYGMFEGASSFNGDLSSWDVSAVNTMSSMFKDASSFNGDLSGWDVSEVTHMNSMFNGASSFNGDIGSWDVSAVTNMNNMFENATSFNRNLSGWNVSTVHFMTKMFQNADAFVGNGLNSWNVENVFRMNNMFENATSFNGDLSGWNVSSVETMSGMFMNATSFNSNISGWTTDKVTDMRDMFNGATSFNGDLSGWNVSSVETMSGMFINATSFNSNISGWNIENVKDTSVMLWGATSFNQNLGNWDIGNIDNLNEDGMSAMFDNSGMDPQTSMTQTLQGWGNFIENNGGPQNILLGLDGQEFCIGSLAESEINWLENIAGWSVTGESYINCP